MNLLTFQPPHWGIFEKPPKSLPWVFWLRQVHGPSFLQGLCTHLFFCQPEISNTTHSVLPQRNFTATWLAFLFFLLLSTFPLNEYFTLKMTICWPSVVLNSWRKHFAAWLHGKWRIKKLWKNLNNAVFGNIYFYFRTCTPSVRNVKKIKNKIHCNNLFRKWTIKLTKKSTVVSTFLIGRKTFFACLGSDWPAYLKKLSKLCCLFDIFPLSEIRL